MPYEKVYFALNGRRVEALFDRTRLTIGGLVFVREHEGSEPHFSATPKTDHTPHCVVWLSPSDWTVHLESRLVVSELDAFQLCTVLAGRLSINDVRKALYFAAGKVPVQRLHRRDTWHGSVPGRCVAVAARLRSIPYIPSRPDDPSAQEHVLPLQSYLLLTCFDILGQSDGWSHFGNWLRKKQDGPDLLNVKSDDPIGLCQELHGQWLDHYGNRNSFYRFINETIDQSARERLIDSVIIRKYPLPPVKDALSRASRVPATDEEKLAYLYKIRNAYTHEGRAPSGNLETRSDREQPRGQIVDKGMLKSFSTVGWPGILAETVKTGLEATLRAQIAEAPPDFCAPDKLADGPGFRSYA